jgi:hypothetical protein
MARGEDTGSDENRQGGRDAHSNRKMRNYGWVGPLLPARVPAGGTANYGDVSDNPDNRKIKIGSTPNAEGHSPIVEFPEGNANGIKLITGTTNHKTKMGARRAAKDMVKNNSHYLLNTKGGVPKRESTAEERANRDKFW